jgi:hypothetical protein
VPDRIAGVVSNKKGTALVDHDPHRPAKGPRKTMILVTGGAGFIGANFVLDWLAATGEPVVNLDKLTYAGNLENLAEIASDSRYTFAHGDIVDRAFVDSLLKKTVFDAVVNFAAESHVDRSLLDCGPFVQTNIVQASRGPEWVNVSGGLVIVSSFCSRKHPTATWSAQRERRGGTSLSKRRPCGEDWQNQGQFEPKMTAVAYDGRSAHQ